MSLETQWPSLEALEQLNPWQDRVFGLALAERCLSNYLLFSEIAHFGNPRLACQLLDKGWSFVQGEAQSTKSLERHLEEWEGCIPDPEDFDSYGVYPAMEAAVAIQSVILATLDLAYRCAVDLSLLNRSTLTQFLEMTERTPVEQDPLWIRERDFQNTVLSQLSQLTDKSSRSLKVLRALAQDEGVSLIGIESP